MLEVLEYTFTVNPESRFEAHCEVTSKFVVYAYYIERENVQTHSFLFDDEVFTTADFSRMSNPLQYPVSIHHSFSVGLDGSKICVPEEVKVLLVGKYSF